MSADALGLIFSNALYAAITVNAIGYALIAIGLNVHFGYTGLLNFGQAGFAAIGAYAVAVTIAQYDWPLFAAIPLIFVGGTVLGLILGVPTLRLRADYLAIVTIAAAEIIRLSSAPSASAGCSAAPTACRGSPATSPTSTPSPVRFTGLGAVVRRPTTCG